MGQIFRVRESMEPLEAQRAPEIEGNRANPQVHQQDRLEIIEPQQTSSWFADSCISVKRAFQIVFTSLFFKCFFYKETVFINPLYLFSQDYRRSIFEELIKNNFQHAKDYLDYFYDDLDQNNVISHVKTLTEGNSDEHNEFAQELMLRFVKNNPNSTTELIEFFLKSENISLDIKLNFFQSSKTYLNEALRQSFFKKILELGKDNPEKITTFLKENLTDDLFAEVMQDSQFDEQRTFFCNNLALNCDVDEIFNFFKKIKLDEVLIFQFIFSKLQSQLNKKEENPSLVINQVNQIADKVENKDLNYLFMQLFFYYKNEINSDIDEVITEFIELQLVANDNGSYEKLLGKSELLAVLHPSLLFRKIVKMEDHPELKISLYEALLKQKSEASSDIINIVMKSGDFGIIRDFFKAILSSNTFIDQKIYDQSLEQSIKALVKNAPELFFLVALEFVEDEDPQIFETFYKKYCDEAMKSLKENQSITMQTFSSDTGIIFLNKLFSHEKLPLDDKTKALIAARVLASCRPGDLTDLEMSLEAFQECFFKLTHLDPAYLDQNFSTFYLKCVPIAAGTRQNGWFLRHQEKISENLTDDLKSFILENQCFGDIKVKDARGMSVQWPCLRLPLSEDNQYVLTDLKNVMDSAQPWFEKVGAADSYLTVQKNINALVDYINQIYEDANLSEENYQYIVQTMQVIIEKLNGVLKQEKTNVDSALAEQTKILELFRILSEIGESQDLRSFVLDIPHIVSNLFEEEGSDVAKASQAIINEYNSALKSYVDFARGVTSQFYEDCVVFSYENSPLKQSYDLETVRLYFDSIAFPSENSLEDSVELQNLKAEPEIGSLKRVFQDEFNNVTLIHGIKNDLEYQLQIGRIYSVEQLEKELGLENLTYTSSEDIYLARKYLTREAIKIILEHSGIFVSENERFEQSLMRKLTGHDNLLTDYVFFI